MNEFRVCLKLGILTYHNEENTKDARRKAVRKDDIRPDLSVQMYKVPDQSQPRIILIDKLQKVTTFV